MKKKAGQAPSYSRVSEPKNNQLVPVNNTNKVRVSNSVFVIKSRIRAFFIPVMVTSLKVTAFTK